MSQGEMAGQLAQGARLLAEVIYQGRSLDSLLLKKPVPARIRAWLSHTLRWGPWLQLALAKHLKKPLRKKDKVTEALLLMALFLLWDKKQPQHAVVDSAVRACGLLSAPHLKKLCNAILRSVIREKSLESDEISRLLAAHPDWIVDRIKNDWPGHWPAILSANQQKAGMWLRVNQQKMKRDQYLAKLLDAGIPYVEERQAEDDILLSVAVDVTSLPGFSEGYVSVQDAAAQLTADILPLKSGDRALDACAAPGGKACHLLERNPGVELIAVEIDPARASRIEENLTRLGLSAKVIEGDVNEVFSREEDASFDAILLDAPCSGSGVIRRHPDIRYLRKPSDIPALVKRQQVLLHTLWSLLRPGGYLLYATCSVFRDENDRQIANFLAAHQNARHEPVNVQNGLEMDAGIQILPGSEQMDGFYYALLKKDNA